MDYFAEPSVSNADSREGAAEVSDTLLASLLHACSMQGLHLTRERVTRHLDHTGDMALEDLHVLYRRLNLQGNVHVAPLDVVRDLQLPAILTTSDHRHVVITSIEGEICYVYLPWKRREQRMAFSRLKALYGGCLADCIFVGDRDYTHHERSAQTEDWLWGPFRQNRQEFAYILMGVVMVNLLGLAAPLYSMIVFNRILPTGALSSLIALSVGLGLAILFEFAVRGLRASLVEDTVKRLDTRIGNQLFAKVLHLKPEGPAGVQVAGVASILGDYTKVRDFMTSSIVLALGDMPFTLLFVGVVWMIAGWSVAVWPLLGIVLAGTLGLMMQSSIRRLSSQAAADGGRRTALLHEVLGGLETLKACGGEAWARRHWQNLQQQAVDVDARKRMHAVVMGNISNLLRGLVNLAVIVSSVLLIISQQMSAGALIAVLMLSMRALSPLAQVAGLSHAYHQANTARKNIDQLMRADFEQPHGSELVRLPGLLGAIAMRSVSFSYSQHGARMFKDLNVTINPGERVAIVGKIGSGKSTFLKLCLGLCSPTSGAVCVDSLDIKGVQLSDLRQHIGYVSQELTLFSGSLRSNIVMRKPDATDVEILEAIRISGLQRVMNDNETSLDQMLDARGLVLSGGQRQTAVLARALLGRPKILLMDEPTSLLDNVSEREFISQLSASLGNQTLVLVTHRQSMLALVDRVIVMDRGVITMDVPKSEFLKSLS